MSLTNMYDYMQGEVFTATDLKQPITGTGIVRLYDNEDAKISLAFSSLVLRTAPAEAGTLLVEDVDYTLEIPDDYYSIKESLTINRGFQITNASYQGVSLYASGNILGSFTTKSYVDTKAVKIIPVEISSDTTLTSAGVYKVTEFCNVTLPASLEIDDTIEIYAEHSCRLYQGDAESVVMIPGIATTKGITQTPINDGTKYVDLKLGTNLILRYMGEGVYSNDTFTKLGDDIATGITSFSCASFSPDGNYLAAGFTANSPNLQIYKRTGDTFTNLGNIVTGLDQAKSVSFSPDGTYLAVGFYTDFGIPNLQVYKRTGDVLLK